VRIRSWLRGSVANFNLRYEVAQRVNAWDSGGQVEYFADELILTPHIRAAYPPNLPLTQHVDAVSPFAARLGRPISIASSVVWHR
jgi:hypothetical protein